MGLGPIRFIESNLVQNLLDRGHELKIETIRPNRPYESELKAVADLNNLLKIKVTTAVSDEYFPLVIGGDCNNSFGIIAGLESTKTGVIWLDAHGDFNTPEITPSGFFDGMPFAILTGQCYEDLWSQIAGIDPVKESHALHVGGRDLDPEEQDLLESTEVQVVGTAEMKDSGIEKSLLPKLESMQSQVQGIYLHVDIDIVDPLEAPGVNYRAPNGFSLKEIERIIRMISDYLPIKAAALTAYNPDNDEEDKTLRVGVRLLEAIVDVVANVDKK
jgi:arginase